MRLEQQGIYMEEYTNKPHIIVYKTPGCKDLHAKKNENLAKNPRE